jgi:hypothetical protein
MKTLIRSVPETSGAEYQLWAELYPVQGPGNLYALRFSSVWTGAKDPEAPQTKGDFFLERENLNQLQNLIKDVLG